MSMRLVIALAVPASALVGALIAALLLGCEAAEDERERARAHADTARRLVTVCNVVHDRLNDVLRMDDDEKAADLAVAVVTAITPCADVGAEPVANRVRDASVFGERTALDTAVRAALDIVPYRHDVDEAPK